VREFVDIAIETGIARTDIVNSLPKWWGIHRSAVWLIIGLHAVWAFPIRKIPSLAVYAKLTFAVLLAQSMTGVLFTQFGFPAFAQPVHILLGFALVLVDLRILLSTKSA
jgi:cytochrome c oxidase assembly protein subunit 15